MTVDTTALAILLKTPSSYVAAVLVVFITQQIRMATRQRHQEIIKGIDRPDYWWENSLIIFDGVALLMLVLLLSAVLHESTALH